MWGALIRFDSTFSPEPRPYGLRLSAPGSDLELEAHIELIARATGRRVVVLRNRVIYFLTSVLTGMKRWAPVFRFSAETRGFRSMTVR